MNKANMIRRTRPLLGTFAALGGVFVGVASCLASQHFVPAIRAQPALFAENDLHFGVDELGHPALCDKDGAAWVLERDEGASMQKLVYSSIRRGDVIQALAYTSK